MESSYSIQKFFDRFGGVYCSFNYCIGYAQSIQVAIKSLEIKIAEESSILDLGCGEGLVSKVIKRKFPKSRIAGFDLSEKMLDTYLEKFPSNNAFLGNFNTHEIYSYPNKAPLKLDNCFDLVISTGSISEYGQLEKAIPFVYNLLKTKGLFINFGNNPKNIINKLGEKIWKFKSQDLVTFGKICKESGFREIEFVNIPFPANLIKYCSVAKK